MIQPDAKCVVNGHKVNEVIDALNPLLNMDIIVGNVAQPMIQYSAGAVQIVIPPGGGASTNEQLDIVDSNNQASTRWFLTTTTQGSGGAAIASGTGTNIGSAGGKNSPAATKGDRDKLGGGTAGGPAGGKNRDNLDRAAAGGGGAPIGGGGQGGNANPPVNIDGGGGGAAGGGGQVRTPAGSATAIGGRRSPSAGDVAPETLPASEPAPEPASPAEAEGIPLTASGQPDLSRMTPEQKEEYGFTDDIPSTAKQSDIEKNKLRRKAFDDKRWESSTEKFLLDQDKAKRQAEADRMAAWNKSGAKYSPYARGKGFKKTSRGR